MEMRSHEYAHSFSHKNVNESELNEHWHHENGKKQFHIQGVEFYGIFPQTNKIAKSKNKKGEKAGRERERKWGEKTQESTTNTNFFHFG